MRAVVIVVAGIGLAGCVANPAGYAGQAYTSPFAQQAAPVDAAQYAAPGYGYGAYGGAETGPDVGYAAPGYGYAAPAYVQPYATEPVLVPQVGIGIGSYGGGIDRDRFVRERLERERFERERVQRDRLPPERVGQARPDIRPYAGPPQRTVPVAQPRPPRPEAPAREQHEQRHLPWERP